MKRIKQTRLKFQDSKSDKVYEVELCDMGNDKYVVNFRYGRRGANLKEGTKTEEPVSLAKAESIYTKLVVSKGKKGYVDESTPSPKAAPNVPLPELPASMDSREAAILGHLKLAIEDPQAQKEKNWNIRRVMWRAGELRMPFAIPYLLKLHNKGDDMHSYSAIWALGRCGAGEAAESIVREYIDGAHPPKVRRMAQTVMLDVLRGEKREAYVRELWTKIPPVFKDKAQAGDYEGIQAILKDYLSANKKKFDFLFYLYLVSGDVPAFGEALAKSLKTIEFRPPFFKIVRAIFKTAEYRGDGRIYGLLAYRFENENPMYTSSKYGGSVWTNSGWIWDVNAEKQKKNPKIAYSNRTQAYMNRRILRWLDKLIAEKDTDYVKIAVGILLSYSAKDGGRPLKEVNWNYNRKTRRYDKKTEHFDSFYSRLLMNRILFTESPRYEYVKERKRWRCKGGFKPGMDAPGVREEACPELWDKMPTAFVHLLVESDVRPILEFALRSFKGHDAYGKLTDKIGPDLLSRFLEKTHRPTALWGLDLAKKKYDPKRPDRNLTLTMLGCSLKEARTLATDWISDNYDFYFSDTDFIFSLVTHKEDDVRAWMKKDMGKIAGKLTKSRKQVLVGRIMSKMLGLESNKENNTRVTEYASLLENNFNDLLKSVGLEIVRDFMRHPLEENQKFAARLIVKHETEAEEIPRDLFNEFINSKHPHLRRAGILLFGKFSDNTLLGQQDQLVKFATSNKADVRKAVRPVIKRLANQYESFANDCVDKFVPVLLRKETYEGLHNDTYELLTQELEPYLKVIERKKIFRLLNSDHTKAQELGTVLVNKYIPADSLSVPNIIRLANHEILMARETAWRMFNENAGRMRYEREEALRLMDSDWDDTRAFSFEFFRENYQEKDWTPELLVSICDSVRPDVSAFGRELITRFFKEEDGTQYLLKLSQHPTPELQLFATNYLERFASDDLEKFKKLEFFFVTVLSQVNRGRVAKNRVLRFLRQEAMKLPEAAEIVARILERLSMTIAIEDKAKSIEMMRDIHEKYPHIQVPISLVAVEA